MKFKNIVCGTCLKRGDFITYNGRPLCGYGIADIEDLYYIDTELDVCLVFGNVYENTVNIKSVINELIKNGAISKNDIEATKTNIQEKINKFLNNN